MNSSGVDADLLRSRYRLTKQRAAVLAALDDGAHLTAEALLDRVRAHLPNISLGTIYRTVDILRELGLVQMFAHAGMAARYEASLSKHHHLVCDRCRDITNVNIPALSSVIAGIAVQYRYDDIDASLTITGRCAACAAIPGPPAVHAQTSREGPGRTAGAQFAARTADPGTGAARPAAPGIAAARTAGPGTPAARTAGPGTPAARTAGSGTAAARTAGPGTPAARTAAAGTATARTAGPGTPAARTAAAGTAAARTADPGTAAARIAAAGTAARRD